MRLAFSIAAVCLMAGCLGSGGGGGTGGATTVPTATSTSTAPQTASNRPSIVAPQAPTAPIDQSFAGMLNGARASSGAGAVSFDARLGRAAQAHANDMLANGYFSHTGLNGSSAGDRIRAQGYNWRTYGENIARGQQTEEQVFNGWQNSSGHRANNLNPNFEDFGLAKAGNGSNRYWVLVLAAERP